MGHRLKILLLLLISTGLISCGGATGFNGLGSGLGGENPAQPSIDEAGVDQQEPVPVDEDDDGLDLDLADPEETPSEPLTQFVMPD